MGGGDEKRGDGRGEQEVKDESEKCWMEVTQRQTIQKPHSEGMMSAGVNFLFLYSLHISSLIS